MSTINGCGTQFFGDFEQFSDGSYLTIKWIVICYIPIFPISTYRIYDAEIGIPPRFPIGFTKTTSTYSLQKQSMHWVYALELLGKFYFFIGSIIGLVITMLSFFENIQKNLLIITICFIALIIIGVRGILFYLDQRVS